MDSGRGKRVEKLAVIDLLSGHSTVQGAVRRALEEGYPTIPNPYDGMKKRGRCSVDYTRNMSTEEQGDASKSITTSCTMCVVLYVVGQRIDT